jgi:Ser/Thr protein kinase RdoA (MazF antagonist)
VIARFDVGPIRRAREYPAGSRRAPKLLLETGSGRYLLKRRMLSRHPLPRIRFAHAVQRTLERCGFPVAGLVPTSGNADSLVIREGHVYELFRFVEGTRFDRTGESCGRAGESAAWLHRHLAGHATDGLEPASFHRSPTVGLALRSTVDSVSAADPAADRAEIAALVRNVSIAYAEAAGRVEDAGFPGAPLHTVHGDFHPGNLLFSEGRVVAVLDFDSVRHEPRIVDIANGMMQFAQLGQRGVSPLDWPSRLDPARCTAFLAGYGRATDVPVSAAERTMIPPLMIEALIAESVIPIANTGTFADLPAGPFLATVVRKCEWIRENAEAISAA